MAQTKEGAILVAAKKIGVSVAEYRARKSAYEQWCTNCKAWHHFSEFGIDNSRGNGLTSSCKKSKNKKQRTKYAPKPRPAKGRSFVPARDNDKKQARRRINHFVECGLIPRPNDIPCVDCGHVYEKGGMRHEYDHYKGYAAQHHEDVEALCASCHVKRECERRRDGGNN